LRDSVRPPAIDKELVCEPLLVSLLKKTSLERLIEVGDDHRRVRRRRLAAHLAKKLAAPMAASADPGHEVIVANARPGTADYRQHPQERSSGREGTGTLGADRPRVAESDPALQRTGPSGSDGDSSASGAGGGADELVNAARGLTKSHCERLVSCGTDQIREQLPESLSEPLQNALRPLLAEMESLSKRIREYDEQIESLGKSRYFETELLKQVHGMGALTALTYVLTLDDPYRLRRSRDAGAYFGLRPQRRESGDSRPQLQITNQGDVYMRKLLVQCAHHILGPFGSDSDLRQWGLDLAARGRKNAKKRALMAVARKLAVLLDELWAMEKHTNLCISAQTAKLRRREETLSLGRLAGFGRLRVVCGSAPRRK
jgi:Transposase IS116/IS110/IS902 family